jgi:hypothetical protein
MNGTSTVDQVFTVRVGPPGATVASTLTCTIPAGSNSGSSTGVGSATVAPGNILDIATQDGTGPPSVFGSFALAP